MINNEFQVTRLSVDTTDICRFYSLQWMLSSAEREQNLTAVKNISQRNFLSIMFW